MWWHTLTIILSAAISLAAFVFSLVNWRERRSMDRRDLFLRVHERLVDIDIQRGRRILGEQIGSPEDALALFREYPEDYDLANRSLAMLDVAALYVERGDIEKPPFMQDWGPVYAGMLEPALHFISARTARHPDYNPAPWPHFQALAREVLGRTAITGQPGTPG